MTTMIKQNRKLIIIIILVLLNVTSMFFYNNVNHVFANDNSAEIIMEVNTNRILHEKNISAKKYMASTTKILTAIIIIEKCNLNEIVTVTEKSVGIEGSSIYLEVGEKLTVKDLLYGLMLRSGNDCAETLALHCSGSIKNFALLMNEKAKEIGAKSSNFVNPHGLHNDNHYTTAYDLALISCYAIKNQTFKEIVLTKSVKIPFSTRDYDRHIKNKNKMLNEFDGATGIKTGFTKKAGRCLVTSCTRNGLELVCAVLNCPPMFEKSKELLTNCFSNYISYKLVNSENIIDFIENELDEKTVAIHVKKDIILPLKKEEKEQITIEYDYPKKQKLSNEFEEEIGLIKIYCKNNLIFTEKIYTII